MRFSKNRTFHAGFVRIRTAALTLIWNKYIDIEALPENFDSIHAVAGDHPPDIKEQWGFTVCGGLGIYRPTLANIALWAHIDRNCRIICDDQRIINLSYQRSNVVFFDVDQTMQNEVYSSEIGYHKIGVIMGSFGESVYRLPIQIMVVSRKDMLRGGMPRNCKTTWIMNPPVPKAARFKENIFKFKFKRCLALPP